LARAEADPLWERMKHEKPGRLMTRVELSPEAAAALVRLLAAIERQRQRHRLARRGSAQSVPSTAAFPGRGR